MFTGIIRDVGTVEQVDLGDAGARLRLRSAVSSELGDGDSIAVSGVCLTVSSRNGDAFEADVMNQTLAMTTLGQLEAGDPVNLEPALRAGEPLGGHLVQGHVDGTGEVLGTSEDGFARRLYVGVSADLLRYAVARGSVAVDGVSLTVAALTDDGFEASLVPETLERTTLGGLGEGDRVNLELDVVARYVERLMQGFASKEEATGNDEQR